MFIQIYPGLPGEWSIVCALRDVDASCGSQFMFVVNDDAIAPVYVGLDSEDDTRSARGVFIGLAPALSYTLHAYYREAEEWVEAAFVRAAPAKAPVMHEFVGPLASETATRPVAPSTGGLPSPVLYTGAVTVRKE